ncbi:PrgI family protein [Actinoplanes sp. NPDC023714]|uniref:PrgI family protein n=1 Tax=Actinoplanes sp. NPDC023714 TaxID=3154322 RepID=UPI0033D96DE6
MIDNDDVPQASVPADIGAPDTIAWGLTFRQLAILGTVAAAGWLLYSHFGSVLPPAAWLTIAAPVAAITIVVVLGRRDGLPLDVWLRHGLALTRSPRTLSPGRTRASSVAVAAGSPKVPAPLRSPVTSISPTGVLTSEGAARVLIACGTTNIHLRTGNEQSALLDGFARFLNALTAPAQIVVAAQRHDLRVQAEALADQAPRLPHPALQAAAEDHAAFLADLDSRRDPLRRQVMAVITGEHAAESAVRALSGLGVEAAALDGPAVAAALAGAVDPFCPPVPGPRAVPGIPITLRSTA